VLILAKVECKSAWSFNIYSCVMENNQKCYILCIVLYYALTLATC